jgi:pimeloyl-ACP methyl ester carboxylesterase
MRERPTIMLVHGAWHGSWCWAALRPHLHDRGFTTAVVDNPSVTTPGSDLAADGANLRRALDAVEGPVVVVGHSYGGAVVSAAGVHPNVERLVYLTAFALDTGESLVENALGGGEEMQLAAALVFDGDTVAVQPERAVELFYHDCAGEVAAAACAQLRPMSMAAMGGVVGAPAWREVPASYVVCSEDRAIPVALQRACAARVGDVREMPTSHSPFLSRPDELARIIAEIVSD